MVVVRYSIRAERDLMEIADYTLNRWGVDQALRYLDELEACCWLPGLRRMEHEKHVIFYRDSAGGILVSRILHQSMLPGRQPMRDDEML